MSLLNIHITAIFFAVGVLLLADHEALDWMRGKKQTLSLRRMKILHYLMWAALLSLIATGVFLFLPMFSYLIAKSLFIIKLLFVAILVVNAVLIGNLMHLALTRTFSSLTLEEKLSLLVSGAVSTLSWASVIGIGLYLFY
jgi:hypothetical protein